MAGDVKIHPIELQDLRRTREAFDQLLIALDGVRAAAQHGQSPEITGATLGLLIDGARAHAEGR